MPGDTGNSACCSFDGICVWSGNICTMEKIRKDGIKQSQAKWEGRHYTRIFQEISISAPSPLHASSGRFEQAYIDSAPPQLSCFVFHGLIFLMFTEPLQCKLKHQVALCFVIHFRNQWSAAY